MNSPWRSWKTLLPALISITFLIGLVSATIFLSGGDPLTLARIGERYASGNPQGGEGYDGQFNVYIALNPNPTEVVNHLDAPAYRYQRILLPLVVRFFSGGNRTIIPWMFPLITILAHFFGTWSVAQLLSAWKINPWYALTYGLWIGFGLASRLDLPETLAYAFISLAFLLFEKEQHFWGAILLSAAVFSKEVTLPFVGSVLLAEIIQHKWRNMIYVLVIVILPFSIFQIWLRATFGSFGLDSGGAMATPFELIPLMGLFRIWSYSPFYALMMFLVFLPSTIGPAIWSMIISTKQFLKFDFNRIALAAFLNSAIILFLPFSTYRETGGLLRISCGLILAVLLLAARYRRMRVLNYSFILIVYNVFLLE